MLKYVCTFIQKKLKKEIKQVILTIEQVTCVFM